MSAKAPSGFGASARRLWTTITKTYDLRVDELRVLEDACREADLIDRMHAELSAPDHELVVKGSMGQPVSSPLVQEIRQHRSVLQRLLGSLRLPDESAADVGLEASASAREAAMARWGRA